MKFVRQFVLLVSMSILGLTAFAQTTGTSAPLTGNWNNVVTGTHPADCCTGGPAPLYDPATGIIHFSYGNTAVHRVIAINQALSGSGVQINGYNWGYDLRNMNGAMGGQGGTDSIAVTTFMTNRFNQFLVQDDRHYNTQFDWTRFSGTVGLPSRLSLEDAGSLGIQFTSRDSGFWGGYYGPQVRNVEMTVNYTTTPVDPCTVNPQSNPSCPGYKTYYNNMWDDGYERVDLPFTFPLYGRTFTTSYMFTNGVVGFLDPNQNSFCCSGINMNNRPGSHWNYAIYGLQTDLGPGPDSRFWSQVGDGGTSMRYGWDRVYDLGTNNASTFNIQIKNTGYIGINYESVNSQYQVTAGVAGDISQGEYSQIYHGWGGAFNPASQYTFTGTEITDQCVNNPLHSPSCPGYTTAMCVSNPLFSATCSGYQQAYFNQQCSANTLYDTACPGYAAAYYQYQCNQSPLYHTGCTGYTQAYFEQQCSLNPLYNNQCTGYDDAYYVQQCNNDPLYDSGCTGYDTAYFNQQCSANALYDTTCPGYDTAYFNQQCSLDPLYNNQCAGYDTAYFNQQCNLDGLYDRTCPNYGEAYAKKNVLVVANEPVTESEVVVEQVVTQAEKVEPLKEVVAQAEAPKAEVSGAVVVPITQQEKPKNDTTASATTSPTTSTARVSETSSTEKDKPKTNRQAIIEKRQAAAKEKAAESGSKMSGEMQSADSMEKQVELQTVVLQAMGFTPGFDGYSSLVVPDGQMYKPFTIYDKQRNVDSRAGSRLFGGTDNTHRQMVDAQYQIGN